MGVDTTKFIRKPLYVDAVRVTEENFDDIAAWCQGEILTDEIPGRAARKYVKVRVHNPKDVRQTKAFVGDWLLYTDRGYKVYTNKAFRASFDPTDNVETQDKVIQNMHFHSVSAVSEDPNHGNGVGEIAPPGAIETSLERPPVMGELSSGDAQKSDIIPAVSDSDSAPPPQAPNGDRILTRAEQDEMDSEEVAELLKAGGVILEQDLVG